MPDVNYAKSILGAIAPEMAEIIPNISAGFAIVTGGITNYRPIYVAIRPRQSKHGGGSGEVRLRKALKSIVPQRRVRIRKEDGKGRESGGDDGDQLDLNRFQLPTESQ